MKKTYFKFLNALVILCVSLSLASCSDDDDDIQGGGNPEIEFYLNDVKQDIYHYEHVIVPLQYESTEAVLDAIIAFDGGKSSVRLSFWGGKLEDMKVGDDLVNTTKFSYIMSYKNEIYSLEKGDTDKTSFKGYGGSVIVREINHSKKTMKIEFSNITLPIEKNYSISNSKTVKIRGSVKDEILMTE